MLKLFFGVQRSPASALPWGGRGREFKSPHSDSYYNEHGGSRAFCFGSMSSLQNACYVWRFFLSSSSRKWGSSPKQSKAVLAECLLCLPLCQQVQPMKRSNLTFIRTFFFDLNLKKNVKVTIFKLVQLAKIKKSGKRYQQK